MKETLAASIIKLSEWDKKRTLIDTFCGSGTIPIEAALIAKNRAPGLSREFAFEKWPWISQEKITEIKAELTKAETPENKPLIFAFDINPETIEIAKKNAHSAGVLDMIIFKCSDFNNLNFGLFDSCTFITNPPYGERLEEAAAVTKMYRLFGEKFRQSKNCSLFLITSREDFPFLFGRRETKNRKLFNGNLKCYLYSYLF
jgi:putative N6-adenine-specific DNA methylase